MRGLPAKIKKRNAPAGVIGKSKKRKYDEINGNGNGMEADSSELWTKKYAPKYMVQKQ